MFASRGLILYRMVNHSLIKNAIKSPQVQVSRFSHDWSYRVGGPIRPRIRLYADLVGAVMFWWILWHLWHEYEHITGEFEYPDPSKWTNSELGIPKDDEE